MNLKFSHIMFYCNNPLSTADWYAKSFGFKVSYSSKDYASTINQAWNVKIDFHSTGGVTDFDRCFPPVPYFEVNNIKSVVEDLKRHGIKVDEISSGPGIPPHASFQDCDGNWLGLFQSN